MLWVCIVSFLVVSVLAGATPDQHPVFRRYPVGKQRSGAFRSADSTFKDDPECDRDEPVYFRLEQLYTEPTERDCLRCMIPRLELVDNPDLCSCLPCSFKMTPGDAKLPPEIADNLFRLKCDSPCGSEEEDYDNAKYLDLVKMLMSSSKKELKNPVVEARMSKKEFMPLGRRTEGGKLSRYMSHCPDGICEDVAPHQFVQGHRRKVNTASGEKVSKMDAANKRARADTRRKQFIMNDKSRAGLGSYNMPYPRPSFHLPAMRAISPQEDKMEEIKFRVQTRRNESNKNHKSGEGKSRNNENWKEKPADGLEIRRVDNLRNEEEEEETKNQNIALAMTDDPESVLVIPDSQNPSTDLDEYMNTLVRKLKKNSGKSTVMKAEEVPEHETEESVEIREFDEMRSAITENYLTEEEEEDSTTVEAYPTTTENTSEEEEEVREFSDETTEMTKRHNSAESTEEPCETTENEYYSDDVKMQPDSYEEDDIGYRNDEPTMKKLDNTKEDGKSRSRPKIVIEIADAKNSSKPGVDGVINMKVDVYSKGGLGNVYRFLSKLIPPEYRSEKVSGPVQLRFQPLTASDSDEYA